MAAPRWERQRGHARRGTTTSFRRRLPGVPLRGPSDGRDDGRRPYATTTCSRITAGPRSTPTWARLPASSAGSRPFPSPNCRPGSRSSTPSWRPTSGPACTNSNRSGPGSGTRSCTPTPWRRAWPARRSSPTRPQPSAPAGCSRSCARCPRLVQAARDNIKDPPGIFVKVGLETLRGAHALHRRGPAAGLRRASTTCTCSAIWPTRRPRRSQTHRRLRRATSRTRSRPTRAGLVPPRPRALRAEAAAGGGHRRSPVDRLLAIAHARAGSDAGGVPPRGRPARTAAIPLAAWRKAKQQHPGAGRLVDTAREQLDGARRPSSSASRSCRCPTARAGRRRADARLLPLDVRQHVDARARSRRKPTRAYLLPHRRRSVVAGRAAGGAPARLQLRRRSGPSRSTRSYPGHFLHYQHLRRVDSKVRKSTHVRAGLVRRRLGALLRADDDRGRLRPAAITTLKLGQLAEALVRLARFVVGIRLHAEDLSVEQGVRFFRDEAFLEEGSARREAERGTFDPTYLVYSAGKLMLLKLRARLQGAAGRKASRCARSTTRCSATGCARRSGRSRARSSMLGRTSIRGDAALRCSD